MLQVSRENFLSTQRIRPLRKKKIFHKTNPLVKIRQFPTFGDIRKSVESAEMEVSKIQN